MSALLTISNLHLEHQGYPLLKGISLSISRGEKVAIVGQNGAGKSSLMRVIAGLSRSYQGEACLEGEAIKALAAKELAQKVSLVLQRLEFIPAFTVEEFLELQDLSLRSLNDLFLALMRDRHLPDLSGGELQRVVLTAAIARRTRLLLMDEPTAHLDPTARMEIEKIIRRYHDEGGVSYILVTHDIELALRCAERVVIMRSGGIFWDGATSSPDLVAKISEGYGCPFVTVRHPSTGESVIIPG